MPWLTIIVTLLSFFASKRSGASNTKALVTAGLAGGTAYYVSHETDWGKANLGSLDGVTPVSTGAAILDAAGKPVLDPVTGLPLLSTEAVTPGAKTSVGGTGAFDVLKSWGATGTATVLGTAAIATSPGLQKYLPLALIAGAAFLVLK